MPEQIKIITFYKFLPLQKLSKIRAFTRKLLESNEIKGTILIASEGYNGTISGSESSIDIFLKEFPEIIGIEATEFSYKTSYHSEHPFQKTKVKVKPEIVTLRQDTNVLEGTGTHIAPKDWNNLISQEDVYVLDTRNEYEYELGTFENAKNPVTENFTDTPEFVKENIDPDKHKKIAMFCTGGIRCEKFSKYMMDQGFKEVYQLEGGILNYLEKMPKEESKWKGNCFVFDSRYIVDHDLKAAPEELYTDYIKERL